MPYFNKFSLSVEGCRLYLRIHPHLLVLLKTPFLLRIDICISVFAPTMNNENILSE